MDDLGTLRLGPLVGMRVRELRMERGWSQRDLASALNEVSETWTRAKVAQLETSGVRGEKLTDLAMICLALEVSLDDLLSGTQPGTAQRPRQLLREALAGTGRKTRADFARSVDPSRIGAEDTTAELRLAENLGKDLQSLYKLTYQLFAGATPSQARDAIAQIDETTSPNEARAKRGQAMRRVQEALEVGEVDAKYFEVVESWLNARAKREEGGLG